MAEAGSFGGARRPSFRGLALTAAAHAALLPLALSLSHQVGAVPEARLVTMNLSPPAPPPPPPAPVPDQPAETAQPSAPTAPPVPFVLAQAGPVVPVRAELSAPISSAPVPAVPSPKLSGPPARPAAPSAPATIASDGLDSSLVSGAPPRYPRESRRQKEQGTVELLVIVGTDGRVETIAVARSSGSPRLDQAALKAVSGWRWQPQRVAGQAVKVRGIVEIPFVLTSHRKSPSRADCDTPGSRCRSGDGPAHGDRHGRMDRRHGDFGHSGPDGEE